MKKLFSTKQKLRSLSPSLKSLVQAQLCPKSKKFKAKGPRASHKNLMGHPFQLSSPSPKPLFPKSPRPSPNPVLPSSKPRDIDFNFF